MIAQNDSDSRAMRTMVRAASSPVLLMEPCLRVRLVLPTSRGPLVHHVLVQTTLSGA